MANNDQILLGQIVEEQRKSRMPGVTKSEFFELYTAEQVLKDYDLSDDEIEYGLVGAGNDGGIDSIYTFVNGELVQEDFDHSVLKKGILVEVIIIQAKLSAGFDEDSINRLMAFTGKLFHLGHQLDDFQAVYNSSRRVASADSYLSDTGQPSTLAPCAIVTSHRIKRPSNASGTSAGTTSHDGPMRFFRARRAPSFALARARRSASWWSGSGA